MRRAAALLLLLVQLKPLVGAAVCFQTLAPRSECPMPDDRSPGHAPAPAQHDAGQGHPAPGCPAADVCAAIAPAIAAVPVLVTAAALEQSSAYLFQPGLHSVDPAAPPAPPPNN